MTGEVGQKPRTRARLLRAMIEAGSELGYPGSTVDRVVGGTGIARSTFYEHFADKSACFVEAVSVLGESLLGDLRSAVSNTPSASSAVNAIVEFATRDPAGARVLFVESLAAGPQSLRLRQEILDQVVILVEPCMAAKGMHGLPAEVFSRCMFRLLAIRLGRSTPDLDTLPLDIAAWAASYESGSELSTWRELEGRPMQAAQSSSSLPPLDDGRLRGSLDAPALTAGRAGEQRLRILDAIATCTYEHGYQAVTVAEVAAQAEVSRKAFYAQFEGKRAAALEANERIFQGAMSACAAGFFSAETWPDRIWQGGAALLDFFAANPRNAYLGFVESAAVGEAAIGHAYDRLSAFSLFLEEGYRYRPEAGELPRTVSEALMATMFEWGFQELWEKGDANSLRKALPQLSFLVLVPFMGGDAASEFVEGKLAAGQIEPT